MAVIIVLVQRKRYYPCFIIIDMRFIRVGVIACLGRCNLTESMKGSDTK